MSLMQIAATPKEIEVGGKTYKLSILSLGDWAKIFRWAEDRFFDDMGRRLKVLPADSEAFKELAKKIVNLTRAELLELSLPYTKGSEASSLQLWLMLKHNHPDISKEEAHELMSFKQFLDIQDEMLAEDGGKESAPPSEKKLTWATCFALLAREFKWSVAQILELTPFQFSQFMKFCEPREDDKHRIEYEKESGLTREQQKATMQKFIEAYRSRGMKVPGM